jgi:glycosyltransferase involved in cell wall biosynthesis
MKISVVVPAFNEEKLLPSSLPRVKSAMEAFAARGWESELIVCDNNSTDRTAEIARGFGAKVAFEPVNQISRARNCGAAAANGDWLVFVDADSWPTRELFDAVARRIESGRVVGGGAVLRMESPDAVVRFVTGIWNRISRVCHWAAGSFVFCETVAFRAVGGFSEQLYASEEIDLSKKLKVRARLLGRQFIIISETGILTSDRRARMYTAREHLRFFWRIIKAPRATVASREGASPWYDGRR